MTTSTTMTTLISTPTPSPSARLETPRLVLEPFGLPEHIKAWCEMDMDADIMRHIRPPSPDMANARARLAQADGGTPAIVGNWGVREKESNIIVGRALLRWLADDSSVEIGYRLNKICWGKGYASELAQRIVVHGFETLRLPAICGVYHPANLASRRVLEKCGMVDAGTTNTHGGSAKPVMRITATD
ncbi:GNAT family N-acetyltransferase [Thalassospira mesophila]|uniref:GNAT family N-acetyltransferase n=1 Tax=Thalassospira mesophila TaxID=1293891 RepID=UPI000A1DA62C|nr:GNAT family N-acetyltransferase [Thalassospira mesophila]